MTVGAEERSEVTPEVTPGSTAANGEVQIHSTNNRWEYNNNCLTFKCAVIVVVYTVVILYSSILTDAKYFQMLKYSCLHLCLSARVHVFLFSDVWTAGLGESAGPSSSEQQNRTAHKFMTHL